MTDTPFWDQNLKKHCKDLTGILLLTQYKDQYNIIF